MLINYAQPGMKLTQDVTDEYGKLLLEKGITLTETYIKRLKHLGIHKVNIFDHEANLLKQHQAIPYDLRTEIAVCLNALFTLQTSIKTNDKLTLLYFKQIGKLINTIISKTEQQMANIINTQIRHSTPDDIVHAVNVCLLSLITGLFLKLPKIDLYNLALGALLHDIGKSLLLRFEDRLFDSAKLHTLYGSQLLLKYNLNPIIARIVAEHHETLNGSGLPEGLTNHKIHHLSKIVSIANFFDNHMTKAALKETSQQQVLEFMLTHSNTLFDANLVKAFIYNIPIYPVGSFVLLNTKKTAYVLKNHPHAPLQPQIKLHTSSSHNQVNLINDPTLKIIKVIAY